MNSLPPSSEIPALRASGTLLHRQLFMVLRDEIARGIYAATGALPKEEALCERFQVSRITVRRALADLAALGLVERRHGLGTFVKAGPQKLRTTPSLSFMDSLRKLAAETDIQVLQVERAIPPPDIATLLQLSAREVALHAFRLRTVEGAPVALTEAWVPGSLAKRVTAAALRKRALYEILILQGVKFGRVVQEITAQAAPPDVALRLRIELGAPLLKLARLMHDQNDRPVQHLLAFLPPERSWIVMDIPGEKINTVDAGRIVHESEMSPRILRV